jgi:hypothetical protein
VALQMLSSVYYGIFLATLIAIGSLLLLIGKPWTTNRRAMIPLAAGAVLALALTGAYARPYLHARDRVGGAARWTRSRRLPRRPADYLVVPHTNWLYGRWQTRGEMERRLFPGAIALLLATVALLLRSPSRVIVVYLLVGVAAFEASLGLRGYSYSFLYEYLSPFSRAPSARASGNIRRVLAGGAGRIRLLVAYLRAPRALSAHTPCSVIDGCTR